MIKPNVNQILTHLTDLEKRFTKEELANTNDDSIRWRFHDIRNELKTIVSKSDKFRTSLENTIRNHYDWL